MKIATWNLQSDKPLTLEREALFRKDIDAVGADVWVLTETWVSFSPGNGYQKVAESIVAEDLQVWPDRRWVAIWVRDALVAPGLTVGELAEPDRSCAARVKMCGDRHLVVFGTVLPWRSDAATELRGAAKFVNSLESQAGNWQTLRKIDHLCVAGDFNQELESNGPTGTKLGCSALTKALSDSHLECMTGGKNDPLRKRGWGESIDHIMLDGVLAPIAKVAEFWPKVSTLSGAVSDHYGVCVEF